MLENLGCAIAWDGYFKTQTQKEVFSSVIDLILNCAGFIYIGAWLPFDQFNQPALGITPWRLIILAIIIIVLRRIPCLFILSNFLPEIANWREALFAGHFGMIQVLSINELALVLTRHWYASVT